MYNDIEKSISDLKDKLSEETQAIVSADIINILSQIKGLDESLNEKVATISKLENDKSELLKTNGELFRKLGEQINEKSEEASDEKEEVEDFDISELIDEKGNII